MDDLIIYFGLPDFVFYLLLILFIAGGIGWWIGSRRQDSWAVFLDGLPYGAMLVRQNGRVLAANAEARKLWDFLTLPKAVPEPLGRLMRDAQQDKGHCMRTLDAPSGLKLRVWAASVDEKTTLLILEDFTARKQQEGFYRNFISNVSHELKTPLTVIQGHASALDHGGDTNDPHHTSLRIITQETARLTQLVENLLWLSRLEMPDFTMERKPVNVEAVVEDSILQLSDLAEARGISINLQTTGPLPRILADQSRLKQVCINLLDNAIKYNHDGGTIAVSLDADEDNIICRISDSGEGIPAEDLPHIFEKMYRVARPQGHYVEGSGLGLSIVQRIVEQHRGSISVTSEPGKGTTFTFSLPHWDGNGERS